MAFSSIECLRELDQRQLSLIRDACAQQGVRGGEVLIREGEYPDSMYFVKSGRFRVSIDTTPIGGDETDSTAWVGDIGPGETVGEIGFLSGVPRTATVTAIRDSIVLKLDGRFSLAGLQVEFTPTKGLGRHAATEEQGKA